jgi:hypothetical protein
MPAHPHPLETSACAAGAEALNAAAVASLERAAASLTAKDCEAPIIAAPIIVRHR